MREQEAETMFKHLDSNSDGNIDLAEFTRFCLEVNTAGPHCISGPFKPRPDDSFTKTPTDYRYVCVAAFLELSWDCSK